MTKTHYLGKTAKTVVCIAIILFLGMMLVRKGQGQRRLKRVEEGIPWPPRSSASPDLRAGAIHFLLRRTR
jgi:hypothetical protein